MIIPSALIKLDYTPATDILSVKWPDVHAYTLHEANEALDELLRTVRHYDVKRLLVDSRHTIVSINKDQYLALTGKFVHQLHQTRIEKVARLESVDKMREEQVKEVAKSAPVSSISFGTFHSRKDAIEWLEQGL